MMEADAPRENMELGPVIREYPLDTSKAGVVRAVAVGLIALGGIGLLGGVVRLATADWVKAAVLGVSSLAAGALGVRSLLATRRRATQSVALVRDGLVKLDAGSAEEIPWDYVMEVRQDVCPDTNGASASGRLRVCTVRTLDGAEHRFDAFTEGLDQLSEQIQQETTHRLQPRFGASLGRGESIRFGTVMLGQRGIVCGGRRLSWQSFRGITMVGSRVSIRALGQEQPWASLRVMDLPNPMLFLRLVRSMAADVLPQSAQLDPAAAVSEPDGQQQSEIDIVLSI